MCYIILYIINNLIYRGMKVKMLSVICAAAALSLAGAEKLQVIYIHGWNPNGHAHEEALQMLAAIFPEAEVNLYQWEAENYKFHDCKNRADQEAAALAEKLSALPDEKLQNIILVGHSLGGRIAIRTMAQLSEKGKKIRYGIFLGAAIPDDDGDIAKAVSASILPNINIYNRQDYVLRHVYMAYNVYIRNRKSAFGAFGYAYECRTSQLRQKGMADDSPVHSAKEYCDRIKQHNVTDYLNFLAQNMPALTAAMPDSVDSSTAIRKIQVTPCPGIDKLPFLPDEASLLAGSKILDSKKNWHLLHFNKHVVFKKTVFGKEININRIINVYYIVDNRDRIVYYNISEKSANEEFAGIKDQL